MAQLTGLADDAQTAVLFFESETGCMSSLFLLR